MAYVVLLSEQSKTELAAIKKSGDKKTLNKIANLLLELCTIGSVPLCTFSRFYFEVSNFMLNFAAEF